MTLLHLLFQIHTWARTCIEVGDFAQSPRATLRPPVAQCQVAGSTRSERHEGQTEREVRGPSYRPQASIVRSDAFMRDTSSCTR